MQYVLVLDKAAKSSKTKPIARARLQLRFLPLVPVQRTFALYGMKLSDSPNEYYTQFSLDYFSLFFNSFALFLACNSYCAISSFYYSKLKIFYSAPFGSFKVFLISSHTSFIHFGIAIRSQCRFGRCFFYCILFFFIALYLSVSFFRSAYLSCVKLMWILCCFFSLFLSSNDFITNIVLHTVYLCRIL